MNSPGAPTSKARGQLKLLTALVVILAAVGWYRFFPASAPAPTSQPQPSQVATSGREATGALPVPESVRLESLETAGAAGEATRNPFAYGVRPPPPPPPRPAIPPPQAPVNLPPPAPPGPPPINLRLVGFTELPNGGRMMVTLKDPATNSVHFAFEGDVVDGRYRVVKVGLRSVVVSYVDGSGQRTIGLGG